jgi:hypothetical protein
MSTSILTIHQVQDQIGRNVQSIFDERVDITSQLSKCALSNRHACIS